jgi:hypothetical protein
MNKRIPIWYRMLLLTTGALLLGDAFVMNMNIAVNSTYFPEMPLRHSPTLRIYLLAALAVVLAVEGLFGLGYRRLRVHWR